MLSKSALCAEVEAWIESVRDLPVLLGVVIVSMPATVGDSMATLMSGAFAACGRPFSGTAPADSGSGALVSSCSLGEVAAFKGGGGGPRPRRFRGDVEAEPDRVGRLFFPLPLPR